ncbi:MAG: SPOR domain-containing protein, partial [Candidatus Omnitrophota bacterium]
EAAKLAYADTFFMEQDYAKAGQLYEDALKADSKLASALLLRLSQCALKSGSWPKAREYMDILKQKYPLSLEANIPAAITQAINNQFFTVQVGSFASHQNAKKLLEKLKKDNFDAYIEETNSDLKTLYRVRVGKLDTRAQAEGLKQILEEKGYPSRIYP